MQKLECVPAVNRIRSFDVVKAILIILMVVGHTESPVTPFIYLFHVASFVFFSGYFFKTDTQKVSFKQQLVSKIKSLYIPYLKYMFLFLILYNVFVQIGFYNTPQYEKISDYIIPVITIVLFGNGGGQLIGALWFITLLFVVAIIYLVIHYLTSRFKNSEIIKICIILGLFLVGYIITLSGLTLPRYLDTALLLIPIYYLGSLFRQYEVRIPMRFYLFLLTIAGLLALNLFGAVDLSKNIITNPLFFLIATLAGCYAVLYIAKILTAKWPCKFLVYIGQNTLDILALHFLAFKAASLLIIKINNLDISRLSDFPTIQNNNWNWIIYSIIGLTLSIIVRWCFVRLFTLVKNAFKNKVLTARE